MLEIDPETGDLLLNGQRIERGDPRLYGSVGRNVTDISTAAEGAYSGTSYDPRYYESYTYNAGDVGEQTGYRLRPEVAERLGDRIQVASLSYGGAGEIIDPSLVSYDEEFGVLTPRSNIREPQTSGVGGFLEQYLPYIAAVGMGAAIAATGGFAGLGIAGAGEAGGVAAGEGLGAAAGEAAALPGASSTGVVGGATTGGTALGQYGAMTTGLDGLSATSLTAGGGAANIGATTAALTGGGGAGGSILGSAGQWFSSLSPMAQRAIVSGVGQGASALLANRRQEEAQDFARQQQDLAYQRRLEEEERMRREREIRGTPTAMQFNITPRPGIIGSRIGG